MPTFRSNIRLHLVGRGDDAGKWGVDPVLALSFLPCSLTPMTHALRLPSSGPIQDDSGGKLHIWRGGGVIVSIIMSKKSS